jgi:pilus assembly protein CpaD
MEIKPTAIAAALLRATLIVGLAASLAGCYAQRVSPEAIYPADYRERHPIRLKERERTVDIFLGRNRGDLTPSQRADVLAFAQIWRREASSGIIVEVPQGRSIDRAAAGSMREVHSILTASGVPRRAVFVRGYKAPSSSLPSLRLSYSKLAAEAGPCGLWPHDLGVSPGKPYTENQPYWNFGCANQRNLAAMVDNPADLVQPRGEVPAYATRRSVVLDKYGNGENPSGTYSGYNTGSSGK